MYVVCRPGWYGPKCKRQCGHCAKTVPNCDVKTGVCKICQYGWTGGKCVKPVATTTVRSTGTPVTTLPPISGSSTTEIKTTGTETSLGTPTETNETTEIATAGMSTPETTEGTSVFKILIM